MARDSLPPVTSHTIWLHRPFRTDACFLHGRGGILTENGAPVASHAQEALLRFAG
jgi:acyl-CoA thioesterase II